MHIFIQNKVAAFEITHHWEISVTSCLLYFFVDMHVQPLYRALLRLAVRHDRVPSYKFVLWQAVWDIHGQEAMSATSNMEQQLTSWLRAYLGSDQMFYKPEKSMVQFVRAAFRQKENNIETRLDAAFGALRLLNRNISIGRTALIGQECKDAGLESTSKSSLALSKGTQTK